MEDLLRQYRRATRLKDVALRLRCLRQITAMPPGGNVWKRDLEALESGHMDHIRENLPTWMGTDHTAALEQTLKELAEFSDTTERRQLISDVSQCLEDMYRRRLLHKGNQLLAEARRAHEENNRADLIDAVRRYRQLGDRVYFTPTAEMNGEFAGIYEWYKDAVRREEQQRQFDEALAELRSELQNPEPSLRLVKAWSRVQACGEDIPEEIAERARLAVGRYRRRRRTLRQMAVAGAAILGIIAGTGISSALLRWQRSQLRDAFLEQLDQQWTFCSPEQYAATIELIARRHEFLLTSDVILTRAGRFTQFEEIWRARQADFEGKARAFQILVDGTKNWDTETLLRRRDEVDRLAADTAAALAALRPGIQPARLRALVETWRPSVPEEWRAAAAQLLEWAESPRMDEKDFTDPLAKWEAFKREHQGRIDAACAALLDQAEAGLETANRETDREQAPAGPRQLLEKASAMQGASSNLVARREALIRLADRIDADLLRRRRMIQSVEQARTLPDYLAALRNYRDAFPQHRFSAYLDPILAHNDFYLEILTPDKATNLPSFTAARAMQREWEDGRAKKGSAIRSKLMALGGEKRLTDLRVFELGRWQNGRLLTQRGYLEGTFVGRDAPHRDDRLSAGAKPIVEGRVYFPRANDVEPAFKPQTFHRGLGDYVGKAQLMPHCRFVDELLGAARTSSGRDFVPDTFLAREADRLARMGDIPPLLRLRLLQFLTEQLLVAAPEGGRPIWTDFTNSAARIGGEINWLCEENREVKTAQTHAEDIIRLHFLQQETARQYLFYIAALQEAARLRPVWIGHADWVETDAQPVLHSDADIRELWVFRPADGQEQSTWRIAARRNGEAWMILVPLKPGEPLFAPADGASTRDTLDRLRNEAQLGPTAPFPAAPGWPAE